MLDRYQGFEEVLTAPYQRAVAITPHDTTPLAERPRAIHCGGTAGKLTVKFKEDGSDAAVDLYITQGGTLLIRPAIITTASAAAGLIALY